MRALGRHHVKTSFEYPNSWKQPGHLYSILQLWVQRNLIKFHRHDFILAKALLSVQPLYHICPYFLYPWFSLHFLPVCPVDKSDFLVYCFSIISLTPKTSKKSHTASTIVWSSGPEADLKATGTTQKLIGQGRFY